MKNVEQLLREVPAALPEPDLDPAAIRVRARRSRHRSALVVSAACTVLVAAVIVGALQLGDRTPTILRGTMDPSTSQLPTGSPSDESPALPVIVVEEPASVQIRMQARIEGVLEVSDDGCVGIQDVIGSFSLAAFPTGTTIGLEGDALVVTFPSGTGVPVGTQVVGGGGWYNDRAFAETLLPDDLPETCRSLPLVQFYLED
ncbi:hypothetical protein [Occultella gossypii]|uniref:Uncharacterized protein n=1 Tax=Occultella gossypii TaxID=2800820 RepID=A0ABS7SD96_9MICO|nr:hypothetical protein [Occultella gossypii]MBZ2198330.1 hypothetical protein [Occultella gossypii]